MSDEAAVQKLEEGRTATPAKRILSVPVSNETWKKLKILAIQKDLALTDLMSSLVEKMFHVEPEKTEEMDLA